MTNEYEPPPQLNITENASTSAIWRRWLFGLWQQVQGNTVSDFALEVAAGNVPGHTGVNKFGRNASVAAGTTEEIWGGSAAYSWPDTALMTSISQTADQADLRGATIEVQGLDANWVLTVQDVVLNAANTTTVVTLDTPLIRCFRMKVEADFVTTSPIRVHNAGET